MPAYFAVTFQYDRASLTADYVRALYAAMIQGEFSFGGVLEWGCPGNLTLEEIIQWNQERLERDFEIGYDEDVSHDYRQILLHHPQYRECRVFILNSARSVSLIVPEDEIFDFPSPFPAELFEESTLGLVRHIRPGHVEPLKHLALTVWQDGLAEAVQTTGELGSPTDSGLLKAGEWPSMLPFAIVGADWIGTESLSKEGIRVSSVGATGLLLERPCSS